MFTEIEQEEIINEFLSTIYVNDMCKIMNNKIVNCPCKLEDVKVELCKLNLSNNIINNICKFTYSECEDCKTLGKLPELVERKNKSKAIDKLTFMFSHCYFFPDLKDLRDEFNFSVRNISCLKQMYRKIKNNDIGYLIEIVKCEKYNLDRTIDDLNKVFKYMFDNKNHCRHYGCSFLECPVFKLPSDYPIET